MVHIKEPLLLIKKSSPCGSRYLNGPLPYVRCHITVKWNVLSASLNKTFHSFITGRPEPCIKWFQEGRQLTDQADFEIAYRDCRVTMTIPEVFPQDAGEYRCTAENIAGMASSTTELVVRGNLSTFCFLSLSLSLSVSLSISLYVFLSHSLFTLYVSLYVSLFPSCLSVSLSLSVSVTFSLFLFFSLFLMPTSWSFHFHFFPLFLSLSFSHLSPIISLSLSLSFQSFSLSLSLCVTLTLSHPSFFLSFSFFLSLSLFPFSFLFLTLCLFFSLFSDCYVCVFMPVNKLLSEFEIWLHRFKKPIFLTRLVVV